MYVCTYVHKYVSTFKYWKLTESNFSGKLGFLFCVGVEMAKFNEVQKRRRAALAQQKRAIHGDPVTSKLKQKPQPLSISGKRKRKLFKKWRRVLFFFSLSSLPLDLYMYIHIHIHICMCIVSPSVKEYLILTGTWLGLNPAQSCESGQCESYSSLVYVWVNCLLMICD